MAIKQIPLRQLESDPQKTLRECCDSGDAVVVEVEGAHEALEGLLETAREGPAMAMVTHVDVSWSEGAARFRDFRIGRTS